MKKNLNKEQSARLIELGIAKEKATGYITELYHGETEYIDVFSLNDLLELLPKEIEGKGSRTIKYNNVWNMELAFYDRANMKPCKAFALIDALYELLIWVIEKGLFKRNDLKIYTQDDWEKDNTFSPQIGQLVEDDIINELGERLCPTYCSPDYFQPSEAEWSRESDGEPLYMTFKAEKEAWRYIGLFPDMNNHDLKI